MIYNYFQKINAENYWLDGNKLSTYRFNWFFINRFTCNIVESTEVI